MKTPHFVRKIIELLANYNFNPLVKLHARNRSYI